MIDSTSATSTIAPKPITTNPVSVRVAASLGPDRPAERLAWCHGESGLADPDQSPARPD